MTAIDFLRHGATNAGGVLLGRKDLPLSVAGKEAAERALAGRSWPVIVSSPLTRARQTAGCAAAPGQAIGIDADWSEIGFGDWEGVHPDTLAEDGRLAAFYRDPQANPPPNGEALEAVRTRVTAALMRLAETENGPVLVVAHAGAIRMALSVLLAIPFERLWAVRLAHLTTIRVEMGYDPTHGLWGEIVSITQSGERERQ